MKTLALAMAWAAICGPALAAQHRAHSTQPSSTCRSLSESIDRTVKLAAIDRAEQLAGGRGDIGAKQSEIQNYLSLMGQNHCSPFRGSLSPDDYLTPALQCHTALLKRSNDARMNGQRPPEPSSDLPSECDMSMWRPLSAHD